MSNARARTSAFNTEQAVWLERARHASQVRAEQRVEILSELHQWLSDNDVHIGESLLIALTDACEAWRDWPLVIYLLGNKDAASSLDTVESMQLAYALFQMGDLEPALSICQRAMFAQPKDQRVFNLYRTICDWRQHCYSFDFYRRHNLTGGEISLELLGHHHCESFFALYHDPAIRELCCLPDFVGEQHWHDWLDYRYCRGDELCFAVLHRYWGMVGCVSLTLYDGVGFFYYWIGKEFRGQRIGPEAVSMLLTMAKAVYGLHTCYAHVLIHNQPSQRGMDKLGFVKLDFQSTASEPAKYFYYRGEPRPRQELANQLHWLFERMNSKTPVAAPVCFTH